MIAQEMRRSGDCLATAVASMLNMDALDLPHTGADDWAQAWDDLREALGKLGWRLTWQEWTGPKDATLADVLADLADHVADSWIEQSYQWIVAVDHPSWGGTGHAIVLEGDRVLFDPGGDLSKRPPLDELRMTGSYQLGPIDPSRFALR